MNEKVYIAIDLKSFYASVECQERRLDPLKTHLVVADASRTEKTICLAVSPSLKAYGISGRARLFEVVQRVKEENRKRQSKNGGQALEKATWDVEELELHPEYAIDYIAAPPRMSLYMDYSTRIYNVYLKYVAPEDIHVYSIDEVFMDVTSYLKIYELTPYELAKRMIRDVFDTTGITATAGIGPNLYLCKVAMDIVAKHVEPDEDGVRVATLDEMTYRRILWDYRPITAFWRVGKGYAKKLEEHGLYTMGDVARCSLGKSGEFHSEDLLYKLFGVNAELLIDHAWGWEPCTLADVKAYKPESNSIGAGQVLHCPYSADKARLIIKEMMDLLALDLVDKGLVTEQLVLTVGYDIENLRNAERRKAYNGEIKVDHYGRRVPKHAHGTINLEEPTSSSRALSEAIVRLYDQIVDESLLIRRIAIAANKVIGEKKESDETQYKQMSLFMDYEEEEKRQKEKRKELERERKMQKAVLDIKKKYGKNAILKGMNLEEGATTMERNNQIGGHKA